MSAVWSKYLTDTNLFLTICNECEFMFVFDQLSSIGKYSDCARLIPRFTYLCENFMIRNSKCQHPRFYF